MTGVQTCALPILRAVLQCTNRSTRSKRRTFSPDSPGATGLAEDVRRYGAWIRSEAEKRIGHFYPKAGITAELAAHRPDLGPLVGQSLIVIAWLWARTAKSPNPAFSHVDVPLVSSFVLSSKPDKEAYIQPIIKGDHYSFEIKVGKPPTNAIQGTKLSRGANFRCLLSDSPIEPSYIKAEGVAGRLGVRLMAIVADGNRSRVYLAPNDLHQNAALAATPSWKPETPLPEDPRNFWTLSYGLTSFGDLFTPRQLVSLNTLADLVGEAMEKCRKDALAGGFSNDAVALDDGGAGALAYGQAISVYLAFAVSRAADRGSSICSWDSSPKMEACAIRSLDRPFRWHGTSPKAIPSRTPVEIGPSMWNGLPRPSSSCRQLRLAKQVSSMHLTKNLAKGRWFRPILLTTTTSAMQICPISSTFGCDGLSGRRFQVYSVR